MKLHFSRRFQVGSQVFVNGPISPELIADLLAAHSSKTGIGAHALFLGQVRSDRIGKKTVDSIFYSSYSDMAETVFRNIREGALEKFKLSCLHIYHSIGKVQAGGICLFVFVSAIHRKDALKACSWIVEEIKAKAPVWGKELFGDHSSVWKKKN